MKFNYLLKESLRGFNSAKLSTLASTFTITLSLILIAVYFTLSVNSNKIIKSIKDKVEIEIFLDDRATQENINLLKEKIRTIGGVKQITFISKMKRQRFSKMNSEKICSIYLSLIPCLLH